LAAFKIVCAQHVSAGGADRDRTGDPLLAKQVLSQLSYSPVSQSANYFALGQMVGLGGLEPPTSPLSGVRSNHLSYRPNAGAWCGPFKAFGFVQVSCVDARSGEEVVLERR